MASLDSLVEDWISKDQNEATRKEIQALKDANNSDELEKRLRKRIEFGTAGLRGRMEAGFSRMNDLIIVQTSQGLCDYVSGHVDRAKERGVVIGHDHRHNSERWAKLTAAVFLEQGFKVYLHRGLVHTPLVPFTIQETKAAAGVMITASHNPKQDNGYKVYWENAVQIISPHDTGIASAILDSLEPRFTSPWNTVVESVGTHTQAMDVTQAMYDAYFARIKSVITPLPSDIGITFVTTPMHGVGQKPVTRAFQTIGLPPASFHVVPEQEQPDPEFPTVSFPNPEEQENADYILAQDPDADRFAAAQRRNDGSWHQFSGDQLGSLFAGRALSKYKRSGKALNQMAMVASTVSSKMIEAMAQKEGFKFVECLTGFKYIGNVAARLVQDGLEVPFGYEEAIGFMVETGIRDKDGVSATVAFVELVTELHARGSTALQNLEELYERYGFFETKNSYFICNDPVTIDKIFARLRSYEPIIGEAWTSPLGASYPAKIAGLKVTSVRDLTSGFGYDSAAPAPAYQPDLPLSGGHMITFRAGSIEKDGVAITLTIRTSGTEPKIKYYLEGQGTDRKRIGTILQNVVAELREGWMEAKRHGLQEP
ncbi:hypothetical protein M408DRAFT_326264 [Serendipita vermifera MAFF 305830]|uniref:Phosphoglucomutase n=1 Tax=Serendipita vermifera MAFF 305830 TaxID=933852 RepID=A0A0C3BN99_SERVB|nr:hypothetical protein M408DRAFT_326264 [Serendipita vermifera MAFF 305830]